MYKILVLAFLVAFPVATPVYSSYETLPEPPRPGSCKAEVVALHQIGTGPDKSDATCDYDFAEFNRRLAHIVESPAGSYSPAYLEKLLAMPPMQKRPDIEPNAHYQVMAGYSIVLAGKGGWNARIEIYLNESDIIPGKRHNVRMFSGPSYPADYADPKKSNCITDAEVFDRAITAGWRYTTGMDIYENLDAYGNGHRIFGMLANDDGRTLRFSALPDESGAPARAKLESTCWIGVSLDEKRILKRK